MEIFLKFRRELIVYDEQNANIGLVLCILKGKYEWIRRFYGKVSMCTIYEANREAI